MTYPIQSSPAVLDDIDRRLINQLQCGFPLCPEPYLVVAEEIGIDKDDVVLRLRRLLNDGVLTRFGPMFQIERAGGAYCLAAMAVPEASWGPVLAVVNGHVEVAHNYRREHHFNMWFVLATEHPDEIARCALDIERETSLTVWCFPKEQEYFLDMRLAV
jgi:DNA-binding Lrp family transcriptional regulator